MEAAGFATSEQAHFDRHGNLIWSEPRGRGLGYNWPQYSIHRGELETMLLAAVRGIGSGTTRSRQGPQ